MSKKQAIRFAVGTEKDPRSSVWRLWCGQEGDIYLAWREGGGIMKISLHKSGKWRVAFAKQQEEGKDRVLYKWLRPAPKLTELGKHNKEGQLVVFPEKMLDFSQDFESMNPKDLVYWADPKITNLGATEGPVITVPARMTKKPMEVYEGMKLDNVTWVDTPQEGQKVCFHIFISSDPRYFSMLETVGRRARIVGTLEAGQNEHVAVVAQVDSLNDEERKVAEHIFNTTKIHLKKGADISNQLRSWVHRYDNNAVRGEPISICDIEMGKENITFDPIPPKTSPPNPPPLSSTPVMPKAALNPVTSK